MSKLTTLLEAQRSGEPEWATLEDAKRYRKIARSLSKDSRILLGLVRGATEREDGLVMVRDSGHLQVTTMGRRGKVRRIFRDGDLKPLLSNRLVKARKVAGNVGMVTSIEPIASRVLLHHGQSSSLYTAKGWAEYESRRGPK
jgi:hypothetical protein